MVVICTALLAGLLLGIAGWGLLGLRWTDGFLLVGALLVLLPPTVLGCLAAWHALAGRRTTTTSAPTRPRN